jgi:RNA polymerase sigma-70 factor (ECF subfamily)
MVDLLNAQPNPEQTTAEILAEARTELVRWAGEQIRTEFSETTWNLFWLTAIEGVSIAEVAQSSGRSAGAIYVARFRVMTRLKEKVSEASQLWDLHESES